MGNELNGFDNHYIGVVPIESNKYQELDDEVRKVLIEHNLHMQPA